MTSAQPDPTTSVARPHSLSHAERVALFGHVPFTYDPQPGNPEHVHISDSWRAANLVQVVVPCLVPTKLPSKHTVHRLVAEQYIAMWQAWSAANLLPRVLTFDGTWASRFKRQVGTTEMRLAKCLTLTERDLSNHAWGTALDINARWNQLGATPAALGEIGCVLELEPIALAHGYFSGAHFSNPDGMHKEAFRVLS